MDSEIERIIAVVRKEGRRNLLEHEAFRVIQFYEVRTPPYEVAKIADEAVASANGSVILLR